MSEGPKFLIWLVGIVAVACVLIAAARVGIERAHYDYSLGYAAAVDSVRAVERKTDVIRVLDAYGASYTVLTFNAAGRETSMVHVGRAR